VPNFEIVVGEDGVCRSLWTDLIDLTEIGTCHVERASNVEFNNETQMWEARLLDGTLIGQDRSRSGAIQQEIDYLNERL
jgi:hypothetical protein